ncbi:MAG TPA: hypothetical protein VGV38_08870, partial [Pyrinomonadaceae bacterium]|nr:hypothetical protein [Pyrinomonadaceae bacterium]
MKRLKLILILSAFTLPAACGGSGDANRAARVEPSPQTTIPATPSRAADPSAQTPPPGPGPDEFASARGTFNAVCVRCHKENGEGGSAQLDEDTTVKVPSFKSGHA